MHFVDQESSYVNWRRYRTVPINTLLMVNVLVKKSVSIVTAADCHFL